MLAKDWLEVIKEAIKHFKIIDYEKIGYASYLMRDDLKERKVVHICHTNSKI